MTEGAATADALEGIFRSVLGLGPDEDARTLRADACEAWDSMAHINLVLALEQAFGFQLSPEDAASASSFEAALDLVRRWGGAP